ncbi:MAG TPA: wax ester/triacylglycerol synthase family O-acyltransferase [Solirubrobacterales bacterium]|nr:wax ester/triacylglycerol synthase family O-acyltransferase [Solirubrobacterales bacterium]
MGNTEPLSPADISSLHAEQGPIHVHVGGTAIFAGEAPDFGDLLAHIEQRLNLIPRFRQRVKHVPGRVARPVWEDDPHFDLRRHVRHHSLPRPGGDAQLRELVGHIMSEPLDQDRPLWQIHLIEGLEHGRFAAISKTHHALVDGVAAVDVGAVILDPDPEGTDLGLPTEPWTPSSETNEELLRSRITRTQERALGLWRSSVERALSPASATLEAGKTARGFVELARNSDPVRPTFLNQEIGRDRRVAFARTSLEDVKRAGRAAGATVNDVVLSVSTGALRRYFKHRGEAIPKEFVALVPMSIRRPDEEGELGNRLTTLLVPLPLPETDPIARLQKISETTEKLKRSEGAKAASLIIEASGWVPPTVNRVLGQVSSAAMSPVSRVVPQRLPWNLVISNVPGPPMPVYLLGRRLEAIHPFVALSPQRRALSIGVISYDGKLMFGLVSDRDKLSDLDVVPGFIDEALAEQLG